MGVYDNSKYNRSRYAFSPYTNSPYRYNLKRLSSGGGDSNNYIVDNITFSNIIDNVNSDYLVLNNSVAPDYLLDNLNNLILDGNGNYILIDTT